MPNGDLLNSHLVNWSSGANKRRSSIIINISHGANLSLVKDSIMEVLLADERILKRPEPSIFFQDISADALELHVYYWSKQVKQLLEIKSDAIMSINQLFLKNDIKVPYPKQEVYVHPAKKEKIDKPL